MNIQKTNGNDPLWDAIIGEVSCKTVKEPILASFFHATILNHTTMEAALSYHLANKLDSITLTIGELNDLSKAT